MIAKFVERAKAVEPEGVVVLSDGQKIGDITLEDGDVIVIPAKSDVVLVSGEVMMPQAMLWSKKRIWTIISRAPAAITAVRTRIRCWSCIPTAR